MSAPDKAGLGYGDQMNKGVLSYENEVFQSVFVSRTRDIEDSPMNDRYAEGMHAVPPPMTGIYQSKPSESDARSSDFNSCESNPSEETHESMPEPVVNEPKVVSQPKVWSDAPIIEEYESDSEDEHVSPPTKEQETPSFDFINTVKHVKTFRQTVKEQNTCSQSPKPDKKDCSGLMFEKLGLGYGFTKKACFAVPTNAARKVNTVKPIVNNARPKAGFHKTLSPFRKPFNRTTTLRTIFSNQKVNTADVKAVSAVWGKRETVVKPSVGLSTKSFKRDKAIVDSGCSRHMTGNKAYLTEYQEFNGGLIAFGGSKGYITGKGKIKTRKLDFKDVCFMKELQHFNLFSVSQMCDKKNSESSYKHALGPKEANHSVAESAQDYFVLPIWSSYTSTVKSSEAKNEAEALRKEFAQNTEDLLLQAGAARASSTNTVNTASTPVSTVSPSGGLSFTDLTNTDQDDSEIPNLEDSYDNPNDGIFTNASYDDEGTVADFTNLETIVNISPIPTSRIHSIHPSNQILRDPKSAVQTRSKVNKSSRAHAFVSYIQKQRRNNHKDFQHCLFACFLSQIEPKKIFEALEDESWVDAMQEELLQFKIQKVWILIDLPYGKKAIRTKWVYRNKKDETGVVVRNKARLVAQGHRQEEG
ncbi:ribonuclease H-like domain-containing protein [Tanacetum coccineum]